MLGLILGLGCCTMLSPMATAAPQSVPVVVELFSSEGCSSCPPADVVLDRLDRNPALGGAEILALELHVDYWNRLGWVDPFSSAAYSQRQYGYADAYGRDGVYTPQMVVDGQTEFNGSSARRAEEEIARAAQRPHAKLSLVPTAGGVMVSVTELPAVSAGDSAELWLALTESGLQTNVPRGENADRLLRHGPVVRELRRVAAVPASGYRGEVKLQIGAGWNRERMRAVVFVQEARHRRILGAAQLRLGR